MATYTPKVKEILPQEFNIIEWRLIESLPLSQTELLTHREKLDS